MYEIKVTGEVFESFGEACRAAEKIRAEVFCTKTGGRRWAPAPKASEKKMRRYRERLAAYEAQQAICAARAARRAAGLEG